MEITSLGNVSSIDANGSDDRRPAESGMHAIKTERPRRRMLAGLAGLTG